MGSFFFQLFLLMALTVALSPLLSKTATANPSPLTQATEYFRTGRYSDALRQFQKVDNVDPILGAIGASRTLVMTGRYAAAEAICRKTLSEQANDLRIVSQLAEILAMTGRSDEALGILVPVVNHAAASPRSLVQYGKLLQLRGRRNDATGFFQRAATLYDSGRLLTSDDLAMIGVANWSLERFHDANRLFREALRANPDNLEAEVLWGDLFREKHNRAEARKSYSAVLERNPKHVPALVGMAKTLHGSIAQKLLQDALAVNPFNESALVAVAEIAIEDDRLDRAEAVLGRILEFNRESLDARVLLAAIAYLEEKSQKFAALRQALAQFSPGNPHFYVRIADICGRKYRFNDAVELARLALQTDPQSGSAATILGMNLLRLGREEEGRTQLEWAFEKDPFNYWTMNMLSVLDVLANFETRTTEHFIVRMHPSDTGPLWPYLAPLLEESWATLTGKYGFEPQGPILVEVFRDHEDFAVRTSGLPDIGPVVGVCFGKVITLDLPRALKPQRSVNWQEVVWHEFAHVITLQMADNRLPRWLSEGISVYEENNGRPEWGRREDLELVKAFQELRILPVKTLNEGFSRAKSSQDLSFAYYQSYLVVEYIVERFGFQALKDLIYAYGAPKKVEDIFLSVFHMPLAAFEYGFGNWIENRVRRINVYVHQMAAEAESSPHKDESVIPGLPFEPESSPGDTVVGALRNRIAYQPRDFEAHLHLGLILSQNPDNDEAIKHLERARDLLPQFAGVPNPRQALADLYRVRGDESAMLQELEALARYQQNAFDACFQLAKVYLDRDNYARAIYYLERAIAVDPYQPDVHRLLANAALKTADYKRAIRGFEILTALEVTDPVRTYTDLAQAYLAGGDKKEAKRAALSALEIAPTFEQAQNILLDSLPPESTAR